MGTVRVRHLVKKPSGWYFQATPAMRAAGIFSEALGTDEATALHRAARLNSEWDAIRADASGPVEPQYPPGTFGRLVADLRKSTEFQDKAPATQDEIEYAVGIMLPIFGPSRLNRIEPEHCSKFYDALRENGSVHRAKRVFKWLRYILNFAIRMGPSRYGLAVNPAHAVRVKSPPPRTQTWDERQVSAAISKAGEMGKDAVAVAIGLLYDTSLRPVDVRRLSLAQIEGDRLRLTQAKTGTPVMLPLWPETVAAIKAYLRMVGIIHMPDAPLLRTPRGRPYTKDYLAKQVRAVLRRAGIPDSVRLSDLRRTASKERAEAGATEAELAAGTGHSIERGSEILDIYNPRSFELAQKAQNRRRRAKMHRRRQAKGATEV